jgi:hypothetical protein
MMVANGETVILTITEADVAKQGDPRLARRISGKEPIETLGTTGGDAADELMQLLPQIITDKIRKIIPTDFVVAEITMGIKVKGSFVVCGIDGDVQLKIKPKSTD